MFPFYQQNFTQLIIDTNGFIFFPSPTSYCCSSITRPIFSNVIAPYNVDLITIRFGQVFYRSIDAPSPDLETIQSEISLLLSTSFTATNAFIITYSNVQSFEVSTDFASFQIILSTNSAQSYVTINYGQCFSTSFLDTITTEIDCLNSAINMQINSIVNPCSSSNVNIIGKWIFNVSDQCKRKFLRSTVVK